MGYIPDLPRRSAGGATNCRKLHELDSWSRSSNSYGGSHCPSCPAMLHAAGDCRPDQPDFRRRVGARATFWDCPAPTGERGGSSRRYTRLAGLFAGPATGGAEGIYQARLCVYRRRGRACRSGQIAAAVGGQHVSLGSRPGCTPTRSAPSAANGVLSPGVDVPCSCFRNPTVDAGSPGERQRSVKSSASGLTGDRRAAFCAWPRPSRWLQSLCQWAVATPTGIGYLSSELRAAP